MSAPFDITREEVLEAAAKRLCDAFTDDGELGNIAERFIREKVESEFKNRLVKRIDQFLTAEMEKLISAEIHPVDMWGESTGKPTTIRATLAERARIFWNVRVNKDGSEESYGGSPRHEVLFKKIVQEGFDKAVKENAEVICSQFKLALKADAARITAEHIDKLIRTT